MATLEARKLTNVAQLGPLDLRDLDTAECAAGTFTPELAIQRSIKHSLQSYAVWNGDRLVMCVGYMPQGFIGGHIRVWCLTTPVVDEMKVWFARASARLIKNFLEKYTSIEVYVWKGHGPALRWLDWLGFKNDHNDGDFIVMRKER